MKGKLYNLGVLICVYNFLVLFFYIDFYFVFNLEILIFLKVEFYCLLIKKNDYIIGELVDNFRFGKECFRFLMKFLFCYCYGLVFL